MPIVTSAGVAGPLGLTGGLDVGAIRMAVEKEPSTCSVELGVSKLIPTFPSILSKGYLKETSKMQ